MLFTYIPCWARRRACPPCAHSKPWWRSRTGSGDNPQLEVAIGRPHRYVDGGPLRTRRS
ncbi:hypothetical protein B0H10DRAFT_2084843 [Mycena sp. CBHHK59/15]|nr:hypothetical protein B0H10DRAFT_2084843 [Mycena sp. CBHHK59/15]